MSRRWAQLQLDDGLSTKISRKDAFQLIEVGELTLVKRKPLTVRIPKHKEYHEEQRHLSGRRIPGVTKGLFNGKASVSSGVRCRPSRSASNKTYIRTIGWVREAERIMVGKREKVKEEQEKEARRKAKKRKRRRSRCHPNLSKKKY